MITYIATPKSKKIMSDALKNQKNGIIQNWDKVFVEQWEARAKTLEQVLYTAGKGK